ncbi:MAG: protein kinase [Bacteroidales bacterium]|nr:protein kinase [Bacteroidales bacterium]
MFEFVFGGEIYQWNNTLKPFHKGRFSVTYLLKGRYNNCLIKKYAPLKNDNQFEHQRFVKQKDIYQCVYPNEEVLLIENQWGLFFVRNFFNGQTLDKVKLNEDQVIQILNDLSNQLKKLHTFGYLHTDIKPTNLLLLENTVKILDFGSCIPMNFEQPQHYIVPFTMIYAPPEMILNRYYLCNRSSDFYMWGMLAFYLFTRKPPFDHCNPIILMHQQLNTFPPYEKIKNLYWKSVIISATYKEPFSKPPHKISLSEIDEKLKQMINKREELLTQLKFF